MTKQKNTGERCPYFQHGRKLFQHGDDEGARDALLLAVDADSGNAYAWGLLSRVYEDMDEPQHAAEAARQAVRSKPDQPDWMVLLGMQLLNLDDIGGASAAFDNALALDPRHGEALVGRAILRAKENDTASAIKDLRAAVKKEPGLFDLIEHMEAFDNIRDHADFPQRPNE